LPRRKELPKSRFLPDWRPQRWFLHGCGFVPQCRQNIIGIADQYRALPDQFIAAPEFKE